MDEKKKVFIIFPEGTRLKPGEKVSLNSGVFAIHKLFKIPILPVRLNSGEMWVNKSLSKKNGDIKIRFFPVIKNKKDKDEVMQMLKKIYY